MSNLIKTKQRIKKSIVVVLVIIWLFSFFMKAIWYKQWQQEINNQVFGQVMSGILYYVIPLLFLLVAILLITEKTSSVGMYLSLILWLLMSSYILLILIGYFNRIPCSCAAIIPGFSWLQQLIFNGIGLILNLLYILFNRSERRLARH